MSVSVTVNNIAYTIPQTSETGWGDNVTSWIQAVSSSAFQKSGGTFTLTAEADFGATFGFKAAYIKSEGTNVASAGVLRLANLETVAWRNAANSGNNTLSSNASDQLTYNGTIVFSSAGVVPIAAGGTNITSYTTGDILYASTTNVLSKLPVGSNGQFLSLSAGLPLWATNTPTVSFKSKTHADTGYTVLTTDGTIIWTLTNGSNDTATLPAASAAGGVVFRIKLAATTASFNTLTLSRAGSDTITLADGTTGATSLVFFTGGETYEFQSDGTSVWQVLTHRTNTDEVAFTPTLAGFGTPVSTNCFWYRTGNKMVVTGAFEAGTTVSSFGSIAIPGGLTIDSAKVALFGNKAPIGTIWCTGAGAGGIFTVGVGAVIAADSTDFTKVYIATANVTDASAVVINSPINGNSWLNSGGQTQFSFTAPITNWKS